MDIDAAEQQSLPARLAAYVPAADATSPVPVETLPGLLSVLNACKSGLDAAVFRGISVSNPQQAAVRALDDYRRFAEVVPFLCTVLEGISVPPAFIQAASAALFVSAPTETAPPSSLLLPPLPVASALANAVRSKALEIVARCPLGDALRPHANRMFGALQQVLLRDLEEPSILAARCCLALLKYYRSLLDAEGAAFLRIISDSYKSLPVVVTHLLNDGFDSEALAAALLQARPLGTGAPLSAPTSAVVAQVFATGLSFPRALPAPALQVPDTRIAAPRPERAPAAAPAAAAPLDETPAGQQQPAPAPAAPAAPAPVLVLAADRPWRADEMAGHLRAAALGVLPLRGLYSFRLLHELAGVLTVLTQLYGASSLAPLVGAAIEQVLQSARLVCLPDIASLADGSVPSLAGTDSHARAMLVAMGGAWDGASAAADAVPTAADNEDRTRSGGAAGAVAQLAAAFASGTRGQRAAVPAAAAVGSAAAAAAALRNCLRLRSARVADYGVLCAKHLWWAVTYARLGGSERLRRYDAILAPAVVWTLACTSPEAPALRKEVLATVRYLLSSESIRPALFPDALPFLDPRLLAGPLGAASHEGAVKAAACSVLADLVFHARDVLSLPACSTVVDVASRLLMDAALPPAAHVALLHMLAELVPVLLRHRNNDGGGDGGGSAGGGSVLVLAAVVTGTAAPVAGASPASQPSAVRALLAALLAAHAAKLAAIARTVPRLLVAEERARADVARETRIAARQAARAVAAAELQAVCGASTARPANGAADSVTALSCGASLFGSLGSGLLPPWVADEYTAALAEAALPYGAVLGGMPAASLGFSAGPGAAALLTSTSAASAANAATAAAPGSAAAASMAGSAGAGGSLPPGAALQEVRSLVRAVFAGTRTLVAALTSFHREAAEALCRASGTSVDATLPPTPTPSAAVRELCKRLDRQLQPQHQEAPDAAAAVAPPPSVAQPTAAPAPAPPLQFVPLGETGGVNGLGAGTHGCPLGESEAWLLHKYLRHGLACLDLFAFPAPHGSGGQAGAATLLGLPGGAGAGGASSSQASAAAPGLSAGSSTVVSAAVQATTDLNEALESFGNALQCCEKNTLRDLFSAFLPRLLDRVLSAPALMAVPQGLLAHKDTCRPFAEALLAFISRHVHLLNVDTGDIHISAGAAPDPTAGTTNTFTSADGYSCVPGDATGGWVLPRSSGAASLLRPCVLADAKPPNASASFGGERTTAVEVMLADALLLPVAPASLPTPAPRVLPGANIQQTMLNSVNAASVASVGAASLSAGIGGRKSRLAAATTPLLASTIRSGRGVASMSSTWNADGEFDLLLPAPLTHATQVNTAGADASDSCTLCVEDGCDTDICVAKGLQLVHSVGATPSDCDALGRVCNRGDGEPAGNAAMCDAERDLAAQSRFFSETLCAPTVTWDDASQQLRIDSASCTQQRILRVFAEITGRVASPQHSILRAAQLLRLFKLAIFSLNQLGPDPKDSMVDPILTLKPYVAPLVRSTLRNAATLRYPVYHAYLLRSLFRSVTTAAARNDPFDPIVMLYAEFQPLQPLILDSLLRIHASAYSDGAAGGLLRDQLLELCLSIPVRLSMQLPYLPVLTRALILGLRVSEDRRSLPATCLRTLENWIDYLAPQYLLSVLSQTPALHGDLMAALTGLVRPAPALYGQDALRLLGKLGGASRLHLALPLRLPFRPLNGTVEDEGVSAHLRWGQPSATYSPEEVSSERDALAIASLANLSHKLPNKVAADDVGSFRLPLARILHFAHRMLLRHFTPLMHLSSDGIGALVVEAHTNNLGNTRAADFAIVTRLTATSAAGVSSSFSPEAALSHPESQTDLRFICALPSHISARGTSREVVGFEEEWRRPLKRTRRLSDSGELAYLSAASVVRTVPSAAQVCGLPYDAPRVIRRARRAHSTGRSMAPVVDSDSDSGAEEWGWESLYQPNARAPRVSPQDTSVPPAMQTPPPAKLSPPTPFAALLAASRGPLVAKRHAWQLISDCVPVLLEQLQSLEPASCSLFCGCSSALLPRVSCAVHSAPAGTAALVGTTPQSIIVALRRAQMELLRALVVASADLHLAVSAAPIFSSLVARYSALSHLIRLPSLRDAAGSICDPLLLSSFFVGLFCDEPLSLTHPQLMRPLICHSISRILHVHSTSLALSDSADPHNPCFKQRYTRPLFAHFAALLALACTRGLPAAQIGACNGISCLASRLLGRSRADTSGDVLLELPWVVQYAPPLLQAAITVLNTHMPELAAVTVSAAGHSITAIVSAVLEAVVVACAPSLRQAARDSVAATAHDICDVNKVLSVICSAPADYQPRSVAVAKILSEIVGALSAGILSPTARGCSREICAHALTSIGATLYCAVVSGPVPVSRQSLSALLLSLLAPHLGAAMQGLFARLATLPSLPHANSISILFLLSSLLHLAADASLTVSTDAALGVSPSALGSESLLLALESIWSSRAGVSAALHLVASLPGSSRFTDSHAVTYPPEATAAASTVTAMLLARQSVYAAHGEYSGNGASFSSKSGAGAQGMGGQASGPITIAGAAHIAQNPRDSCETPISSSNMPSHVTSQPTDVAYSILAAAQSLPYPLAPPCFRSPPIGIAPATVSGGHSRSVPPLVPSWHGWMETPRSTDNFLEASVDTVNDGRLHAYATRALLFVQFVPSQCSPVRRNDAAGAINDRDVRLSIRLPKQPGDGGGVQFISPIFFYRHSEATVGTASHGSDGYLFASLSNGLEDDDGKFPQINGRLAEVRPRSYDFSSDYRALATPLLLKLGSVRLIEAAARAMPTCFLPDSSQPQLPDLRLPIFRLLFDCVALPPAGASPAAPGNSGSEANAAPAIAPARFMQDFEIGHGLVAPDRVPSIVPSSAGVAATRLVLSAVCDALSAFQAVHTAPNSVLTAPHDGVTVDVELRAVCESQGRSITGRVSCALASMYLNASAINTPLAGLSAKSVIAAARNLQSAISAINSASGNSSTVGQTSTGIIPRDLLHSSLRPMLSLFSDLKRLSADVMEALGALLTRIAYTFNGALSERLIKELPQWYNADSMRTLLGNTGREPEVAAAFMNLLHLLPLDVRTFTNRFASTVCVLDAKLHSFRARGAVTTPYRKPFARYMSRHPAECASFFFGDLSAPSATSDAGLPAASFAPQLLNPAFGNLFDACVRCLSDSFGSSSTSDLRIVGQSCVWEASGFIEWSKTAVGWATVCRSLAPDVVQALQAASGARVQVHPYNDAELATLHSHFAVLLDVITREDPHWIARSASDLSWGVADYAYLVPTDVLIALWGCRATQRRLIASPILQAPTETRGGWQWPWTRFFVDNEPRHVQEARNDSSRDPLNLQGTASSAQLPEWATKDPLSASAPAWALPSRLHATHYADVRTVCDVIMRVVRNHIQACVRVAQGNAASLGGILFSEPMGSEPILSHECAAQLVLCTLAVFSPLSRIDSQPVRDFLRWEVASAPSLEFRDALVSSVFSSFSTGTLQDTSSASDFGLILANHVQLVAVAGLKHLVQPLVRFASDCEDAVAHAVTECKFSVDVSDANAPGQRVRVNAHALSLFFACGGRPDSAAAGLGSGDTLCHSPAVSAHHWFVVKAGQENADPATDSTTLTSGGLATIARTALSPPDYSLSHVDTAVAASRIAANESFLDESGPFAADIEVSTAAGNSVPLDHRAVKPPAARSERAMHRHSAATLLAIQNQCRPAFHGLYRKSLSASWKRQSNLDLNTLIDISGGANSLLNSSVASASSINDTTQQSKESISWLGSLTSCSASSIPAAVVSIAVACARTSSVGALSCDTSTSLADGDRAMFASVAASCYADRLSHINGGHSGDDSEPATPLRNAVFAPRFQFPRLAPVVPLRDGVISLLRIEHVAASGGTSVGASAARLGVSSTIQHASEDLRLELLRAADLLLSCAAWEVADDRREVVRAAWRAAGGHIDTLAHAWGFVLLARFCQVYDIPAKQQVQILSSLLQCVRQQHQHGSLASTSASNSVTSPSTHPLADCRDLYRRALHILIPSLAVRCAGVETDWVILLKHIRHSVIEELHSLQQHVAAMAPPISHAFAVPPPPPPPLSSAFQASIYSLSALLLPLCDLAPLLFSARSTFSGLFLAATQLLLPQPLPPPPIMAPALAPPPGAVGPDGAPLPAPTPGALVPTPLPVLSIFFVAPTPPVCLQMPPGLPTIPQQRLLAGEILSTMMLWQGQARAMHVVASTLPFLDIVTDTADVNSLSDIGSVAAPASLSLASEPMCAQYPTLPALFGNFDVDGMPLPPPNELDEQSSAYEPGQIAAAGVFKVGCYLPIPNLSFDDVPASDSVSRARCVAAQKVDGVNFLLNANLRHALVCAEQPDGRLQSRRSLAATTSLMRMFPNAQLMPGSLLRYGAPGVGASAVSAATLAAATAGGRLPWHATGANTLPAVMTTYHAIILEVSIASLACEGSGRDFFNENAGFFMHTLTPMFASADKRVMTLLRRLVRRLLQLYPATHPTGRLSYVRFYPWLASCFTMRVVAFQGYPLDAQTRYAQMVSERNEPLPDAKHRVKEEALVLKLAAEGVFSQPAASAPAEGEGRPAANGVPHSVGASRLSAVPVPSSDITRKYGPSDVARAGVLFRRTYPSYSWERARRHVDSERDDDKAAKHGWHSVRDLGMAVSAAPPPASAPGTVAPTMPDGTRFGGPSELNIVGLTRLIRDIARYNSHIVHAIATIMFGLLTRFFDEHMTSPGDTATAMALPSNPSMPGPQPGSAAAEVSSTAAGGSIDAAATSFPAEYHARCVRVSALSLLVSLLAHPSLLVAQQRNPFLVCVMKLLQRTCDHGILATCMNEVSRWMFAPAVSKSSLTYGLTQREKMGLITALALLQVPPLGPSTAPLTVGRHQQLGDAYYSLQRAQYTILATAYTGDAAIARNPVSALGYSQQTALRHKFSCDYDGFEDAENKKIALPSLRFSSTRPATWLASVVRRPLLPGVLAADELIRDDFFNLLMAETRVLRSKELLEEHSRRHAASTAAAATRRVFIARKDQEYGIDASGAGDALVPGLSFPLPDYYQSDDVVVAHAQKKARSSGDFGAVDAADVLQRCIPVRGSLPISLRSGDKAVISTETILGRIAAAAAATSSTDSRSAADVARDVGIALSAAGVVSTVPTQHMIQSATGVDPGPTGNILSTAPHAAATATVIDALGVTTFEPTAAVASHGNPCGLSDAVAGPAPRYSLTFGSSSDEELWHGELDSDTAALLMSAFMAVSGSTTTDNRHRLVGFAGLESPEVASAGDVSPVACGPLTALQDVLGCEWENITGYMWLPLATRLLLANVKQHPAVSTSATSVAATAATARMISTLSRSVYTSLDICLDVWCQLLPAAWAGASPLQRERLTPHVGALLTRDAYQHQLLSYAPLPNLEAAMGLTVAERGRDIGIHAGTGLQGISTGGNVAISTSVSTVSCADHAWGPTSSPISVEEAASGISNSAISVVLPWLHERSPDATTSAATEAAFEAAIVPGLPSSCDCVTGSACYSSAVAQSRSGGTAFAMSPGPGPWDLTTMHLSVGILLVAGFTRCSPPVLLPPELLAYLGKCTGASGMTLPILESALETALGEVSFAQNALRTTSASDNTQTPSAVPSPCDGERTVGAASSSPMAGRRFLFASSSPAVQWQGALAASKSSVAACLQALLGVYTGTLREDDLARGLKRRFVTTLTTARGLDMEAHGLWSESQDAYHAGFTTLQDVAEAAERASSVVSILQHHAASTAPAPVPAEIERLTHDRSPCTATSPTKAATIHCAPTAKRRKTVAAAAASFGPAEALWMVNNGRKRADQAARPLSSLAQPSHTKTFAISALSSWSSSEEVLEMAAGFARTQSQASRSSGRFDVGAYLAPGSLAPPATRLLDATAQRPVLVAKAAQSSQAEHRVISIPKPASLGGTAAVLMPRGFLSCAVPALRQQASAAMATNDANSALTDISLRIKPSAGGPDDAAGGPTLAPPVVPVPASVPLGMTEGWIPPATELDLWEERWLDCGRHLCQWTMVGSYARQSGDTLAEAEACSRLGDWPRLKECLRLPACTAEAAKAPELRLHEAELSLADPAASGVATWASSAAPATVASAIATAAAYANNSQVLATSACDSAANITLRAWANSPRYAGAASRASLMQTAQRILELRESAASLSQVRAAFRSAQLTSEQSRGAAAAAAAASAAAEGLLPPAQTALSPANVSDAPDLRNMLLSWRDRLPNAWEGMPAWDALHTWRHHVFALINAPTQNVNPSTGQPWVRVPLERVPLLQDASWTVIRLAHTARRLGLKDVAAVMLARLDSSPASALDPSDIFMKLREQLLVNLPDSYSAAYSWLTSRKNLTFREQSLHAYLQQEAAAPDPTTEAAAASKTQSQRAAFRALSTCYSMSGGSLPQARAHAAGGLALINQQLDAAGSQLSSQSLEQRSEVWRLRGIHGEWLGPEAFPAAYSAFSAACQTGRHHGKNWLSWAVFLDRLYQHARVECRLPAPLLAQADDAGASSAAAMEQWAAAMGVRIASEGRTLAANPVIAAAQLVSLSSTSSSPSSSSAAASGGALSSSASGGALAAGASTTPLTTAAPAEVSAGAAASTNCGTAATAAAVNGTAPVVPPPTLPSGPSLAQAVATQAVAAYLTAVALRCGSPSQQIGRALWVVHSEEGAAPLLAALQAGADRTPAWLWLHFMPLLLAAAGRGEGAVSRHLLVALSAAYPQATVHHLLAAAAALPPAGASPESASAARAGLDAALTTARRIGGSAVAAAERLVRAMTVRLHAMAACSEEETLNQLAGMIARCQHTQVALATGLARDVAAGSTVFQASAKSAARDRDYAASVLAAMPRHIGVRLFPPPAAGLPLAAALRIMQSNCRLAGPFREDFAPPAAAGTPGGAPMSAASTSVVPAAAGVGDKRSRSAANLEGDAAVTPLGGEEGLRDSSASSTADLAGRLRKWYQLILAHAAPAALPLAHVLGEAPAYAPDAPQPCGGVGDWLCPGGTEIPGQYSATAVDAEPMHARHVRVAGIAPYALLTLYGGGTTPPFPVIAGASSQGATPSSSNAPGHASTPLPSQGQLCRRVAFVGDDGGRYWFTAAPAFATALLPDCRAALQAEALNAAMRKYADTRSRQLRIAACHFVPSPSADLRLVPASPAEVSLHGLLEQHLAASPVRIAGAGPPGAATSAASAAAAGAPVLRCADDLVSLYAERLVAQLRQRASGSASASTAVAEPSDKQEQTRAGLAAAVLVEAYRDVCTALPAEALVSALAASAASTDALLALRGRVTGQAGATSMWGYMLGAGDRVPCRLVIDRGAASFASLEMRQGFSPLLAHVGCIVDGHPEPVPFRLTRGLCTLFTPQGLLGPFVGAVSAHIRMQFANADPLAALAALLAWDDVHDILAARAAAQAAQRAAAAGAQAAAAAVATAATAAADLPLQASAPVPPRAVAAAGTWSVGVGVEYSSVHRRVTGALGKWMDRVTEMQSPTIASKLVASNLTGPATADDMLSTSVHRLMLQSMADKGLARMPHAWHPWL